MPDSAQRIADNLASVRERIAQAAVRSGRTSAAITLVAVTKYVGLTEVQAPLAAGCRDLGESRPQELCAKAESLQNTDATNVRWHLIGHFQRNKIRRTLPHVTCIHSGDSWRLLAALDEAAKAENRVVPVLLEVNISGDAAKQGFCARPDRAATAATSRTSRNLHARIDGDGRSGQ